MNLLAQRITNPLLPGGPDQDGVAFFNRALPFIINWLLLIGVIYFLINLIFGGYKFISSQGDKNKVQEAQGQLTGALIGLVILLSAFAVLRLIGQIFGLQNLENLQIILPRL